jgi:cellulose synthase/poly-beta-1,6-N-acetylglucosamine synthase-like glycosyltransferase
MCDAVFVTLELVVFCCIALIIYSYFIYAILLTIVAGVTQIVSDARHVFNKRERRQQSGEDFPDVAVVISAFNEERHIRARIENLFALDYPPERLKIYIGSDGSKDGTNAILASFSDPRLATFAFEVNRGKARVLNDLVSRADSSILVFSDANTFFERQALKHLVSNFADAGVGGVSGELRLDASKGDNQDSLYWRVEQYLKFFEGRIGGLLGANGAIYAIRKPLWKPLREDTIVDDFCVAMNVSAAGYRLVYDPRAWANEDTPDSIGDEYGRRVRIGIGNFQALIRHPEYFLRTSWATKFTYVSHKVLRWIAPHLLLLVLLASTLLALQSTSWRLFLALQIVAYAVCTFLYKCIRNGQTIPKILRIPTFLFTLNWALFVASNRYISGRYSGSWRRTNR